MARLVLENVDLALVEKLELRAKRLGTTAQAEASRLLADRLRDEPDSETSEPTGAWDPRFVRQHGFLVFTGEIAAEAIPDHRALREERIESALKGIDENRD